MLTIVTQSVHYVMHTEDTTVTHVVLSLDSSLAVVVTYSSVFFNFTSHVFSCFFFFSSRRRHTRCLSDWSSDVCSSDLKLLRRPLHHVLRQGRYAGDGAAIYRRGESGCILLDRRQSCLRGQRARRPRTARESDQGGLRAGRQDGCKEVVALCANPPSVPAKAGTQALVRGNPRAAPDSRLRGNERILE